VEQEQELYGVLTRCSVGPRFERVTEVLPDESRGELGVVMDGHGRKSLIRERRGALGLVGKVPKVRKYGVRSKVRRNAPASTPYGVSSSKITIVSVHDKINVCLHERCKSDAREN
jgi:hypothetical protein